MKKKLLASLSILAIFAFAIAAYAFNAQSYAPVAVKASCCKSKKSCLMKMKGHDGHDSKGEHAKMDCRKKHCGDHAKADGKTCCDSSGDSCPMKKKGDGAAEASEDKDCCDSCDCCKGKSEKETSV